MGGGRKKRKGKDKEGRREGGGEATQLENEKPKYAAFSLGN